MEINNMAAAWNLDLAFCLTEIVNEPLAVGI
jgi:hypothetical protein